MRGRLWCIRLLLLMVVSALVLSPLVVSGASVSSRPVGWNHDPSALMLPSSPVYPAVIAYRDLRLSLADPSFEKSELLLGFANQDAAAIDAMAQRQDFVSSANHASAYQETFDRCVGWLVIASERGNDVSYLLSRITNDHYAQQAALGEALNLMPEWSRQGLDATRAHAGEVLMQAIRLLDGEAAAHAFASNMALLIPGLSLETSPAPAPEPPQLALPPPEVETETQSTAPIGNSVEVPAAPTIISLRADRDTVSFGESVEISCTLASGDLDDLSYSWWCSRGNLVASGTEATWKAPEKTGTYEVSFTVSDSLDRSDTMSVQVQVLKDGGAANDTADESGGGDPGSGDAPTAAIDAPTDASVEIEGLELTADHKYLDEQLGGSYSTLVSRSCTVRCLVENPEGLKFEWSATKGGVISGSGDTVVFTAPASPCYVKVKVTVSNARGERDTASVNIYVSTCTYCFS